MALMSPAVQASKTAYSPMTPAMMLMSPAAVPTMPSSPSMIPYLTDDPAAAAQHPGGKGQQDYQV